MFCAYLCPALYAYAPNFGCISLSGEYEAQFFKGLKVKIFNENLKNRLVDLNARFSGRDLHFALCGVVAGEGLFALGLPEYLQDSDAVLRQVKVPRAVRDVLDSIWKELDARGVKEGDGALKKSQFRNKLEKILKAHALLDDRLAVSLDDVRLMGEVPWGNDDECSVVRETVGKVLCENTADKVVEFYDDEAVEYWECFAVDSGKTFFVEVEARNLILGDESQSFRRVCDDEKQFLYFTRCFLREGDLLSCYDAAKSCTRQYWVRKVPLEPEEAVPDGESTRRLIAGMAKELQKETEMIQRMSDDLLQECKVAKS